MIQWLNVQFRAMLRYSLFIKIVDIKNSRYIKKDSRYIKKQGSKFDQMGRAYKQVSTTVQLYKILLIYLTHFVLQNRL